MVQISKCEKKRPKVTRKYAAAALPMMLLFAGVSMMGGDTKGIVQQENITTQFSKTPKEIEKEYESRRKRWWKHTPDMPICKHVKAVCSEQGLLPRLLASVAAGAKMRSSVFGIGGALTSCLVFLCAAIGIWYGDRLNKLMSNKVDKEEPQGMSPPSVHEGVQYQPIKKKASDVENLLPKDDANGKDKSSSLYRPEADSSTGAAQQDCLESPQVPSTLKKMLSNSMTYLSGTCFTWTNPVASYKIFTALLLFIELNDLMAPEQTIMYTPEIIALQRAKPEVREYVPYMADYLTPSLSYATADLWFKRLKMVRNVLIVSWLAYLVLPPKRVGGVCYIIGALLYCYLATIGLMYNLGHSMQGGILFILCSILAVPFLGCPKYGDRSARWLRRFLYIGVLVPIYLFSGVAKFRYKGFWPQWTGSWMTSALTSKGLKRSVFPGVFKFIRNNKLAMAVFSWGNVVIEYILPLMMLMWIENPLVQALFHVSCIIFHITIFGLMGPNFIRYCLMHMLAWNPAGWFGFKPRTEASEAAGTLGPITWLDKVRAGFTFCCMFSWFWVQMISDFEHLTGKLDRMERRNPYFPIPELSMFAKPKHPNYTCAVILVLFSLACYVVAMFTKWSLMRDTTETDFWYWMPNLLKKKKEDQNVFKGTMLIPLGEEEIALAKQQGKTFVVYDASSASSLPMRRTGDSPTLVYNVDAED